MASAKAFLKVSALVAGLAAIFSGIPVTAATLVSTGSTLIFNDIYYFVSPYSVGTISLPSLSNAVSIAGLMPITVISEPVTATSFSALISNYTSTDDVFQLGFLQGK